MTDAKLDNVLSRLRGVQGPNAEGVFRARCPVHESRSTLTMTVRAGSKWINLNCFASCSYDAIRQALGLEWKDLVVDEEQRQRRRPIKQRELELTAMACELRLQNEPEVLARARFKRGWAAKALEMLNVGWDGQFFTLPVRDEDGRLHDVLRYNPFATTGRKVLAGHGKSRKPWPAPESVDTHTLFLVEGEGTAISMWSCGFKAVALPGSLQVSLNVARPGRWQGAGWHRKWAERFARFPSLILIPDCDGTGRALMGAARYDLQQIGANVRLLDLAPGVHDGSDVADQLLSTAYNGDTRKAANETLREIIATELEVLV